MSISSTKMCPVRDVKRKMSIHLRDAQEGSSGPVDADADCRDCFPRRHHPGGLSQMFDTDVFMISVSSVEVMFARAVLIVFSAAGSGLSISTISGGSTQITALINQEFANQGLSYTVSSLSANVAEEAPSLPPQLLYHVLCVSNEEFVTQGLGYIAFSPERPR